MEAEAMLRTLPVLLLVGLAFTGCIAAPKDLQAASTAASNVEAVVPPDPNFDFSKIVDPDHASHLAPQLHAAGHGLELAGFASIGSILAPATRGSITQVDVWKNYAVVSGMEGGLAFAIVDISDAAKPKAVSWFPSASDGMTARFSSDGDYIFYGCQMLGPTGYAPTNVRGTCKDPNEVHTPLQNPGGVVVVDVKDKAHPKFVDFLPGVGSHNVFAANINGTDYVFTQTVDIIKFDRDAGKLIPVAKVPGVHDATVHKHPITGDWLLFTGTGELSIYNVNDPSKPEVVFTPAKGAKSQWTGWHEQTLIPGVVDGRVILALAGENFLSQSGVPDKVAFVDVTDPAHPVETGVWTPPFSSKLPWASYLYSAHEAAATPTGQLAIGWYHGGVWVIDVSTKERQEKPLTIAAYQPHNVPSVLPSTFAQTPVPEVPFVWGAGWDERGYLVVPDMHTGLYLMKPDWGLHPITTGGGGQ